MTVTRSHRIPTELFGLSTDSKPTGEMTSSTFHETDTRADFTWTGLAWFQRFPHMDFHLEVSKGNVAGHSVIHKFGKAVGLANSATFVDIWDGVDDANAADTYTFSATADIDSLSSSDGTDTQAIEVQGLDTNFALVTQTITLTGQTRAPLTTDLVRVFRMKNMGTTNNAGQVYCYVDGDLTAGVPNTNADIRAIITIGFNQTLMSIYTIPAATTGHLTGFWAALAIRTTAASVVHLDVRPTGTVFHTFHATGITTAGSSHIYHEFQIPHAFAAKTDIVMRANSSAVNTDISGGFDILLVDD